VSIPGPDNRRFVLMSKQNTTISAEKLEAVLAELFKQLAEARDLVDVNIALAWPTTDLLGIDT
jgi:hypothetical protein